MTVGEETVPLLPPRRETSSFIEEEPMRPAIPPRPVVDMTNNKRERTLLAADLVPDLHGVMPSKGLSTELDTHDTTITKESITAAEKKSVPATVNMPGLFDTGPAHLIPDWYRTGWTALSSQENPGGALNILATRKSQKSDFLDDMLPSFLYGEWYHNGAALFTTAIVSWTLAKMNAGIGSILIFCLFIGKYNGFLFYIIYLITIYSQLLSYKCKEISS